MMQTLLNFLYKYFLFIKNDNVTLNGKLKIKNKPLIHILKGSSLILEDNVLLNSKNSKYHLNMFAPIKIYIDKIGAKIKIGKNTRIHGSCLHAYDSIEIGENCLIAANCQIFDGSGHQVFLNDPTKRIFTSGTVKPIKIGNNCWLGTSVIILPGSKLGNNCIVAAGSVVNGDFEDNSLIGGNPATVIKSLK
ncbi:acyltransferase [Pelagibacterales bacterium SAG-MED18]|nr:acyltransferase [Pelagibacterales bacterium SAG-MED18]